MDTWWLIEANNKKLQLVQSDLVRSRYSTSFIHACGFVAIVWLENMVSIRKDERVRFDSWFRENGVLIEAKMQKIRIFVENQLYRDFSMRGIDYAYFWGKIFTMEYPDRESQKIFRN